MINFAVYDVFLVSHKYARDICRLLYVLVPFKNLLKWSFIIKRINNQRPVKLVEKTSSQTTITLLTCCVPDFKHYWVTFELVIDFRLVHSDCCHSICFFHIHLGIQVLLSHSCLANLPCTNNPNTKHWKSLTCHFLMFLKDLVPFRLTRDGRFGQLLLVLWLCV